ncbi:MAG: hypothetical protein HOH95_06180 [Dehalococcoidia bacterium]|jgi:hypothetical protein|nr:hypothetical protein [Dehalococcoidia bacterium]
MTETADRELEQFQHRLLADIQQPEGLASFRWSPPPTDLTPTGPVLQTAEEDGYSLAVTRVFGEIFRAVLRTPEGDRQATATVAPPSQRAHLIMVKWAPDDLQLRVTCDLEQPAPARTEEATP